MNLERYDYSTNETFLDYEFESDGPNGKIKKIVRFSPANVNGTTYFNLILGDWNNKTKTIDDTAVSNNMDTERILATAASTVLNFTDQFPDVPVFARGSTPARTRLYQMGISRNLKEINVLLEVYGLYESKWEPFSKNMNYDAFLAVRK